MESRITMINELRKRTGIGAGLAMKCLSMADYEMDLAVKIAEYYSITVHKNYPVGRVIREYWEGKARQGRNIGDCFCGRLYYDKR